jgi:predicted Zn-ribbon and HTH transcriptional regulator
MCVEYQCQSQECGYTFLDVKIIPLCKCPVCSSHTEAIEWEGLPDD